MSSFASSLLMLLCGSWAHFSAARVLPGSLKLIAPSIGWVFTTLIVRSRWPHLLTIVASIHGVLAVAGYAKVGLTNVLLNRLCIYPAAATCVGGILGSVIESPQHFVCVALLLMQLWATCGGAVMLLCYPASILQVAVSQQTREEQYAENVRVIVNNDKTVERTLIPGPGGVLLDTAVVRQPTLSPRWVIYMGGNGEFFESSIDDGDFPRMWANVIYYNHRGIGRSTGYVSQVGDLVEDAAAVALYFVEKEHINPKNLLFFGHSIGGGVAAHVVDRCFPDSPLVLDRTFSRLSDAAICFSPFTAAITNALFPILVGNLDTLACWERIANSRKLVLYAKEDEIIKYAVASMGRLPQFQQDGKEASRAIQLRGHSVPSFHNGILPTFQNGVAALTQIGLLFHDRQ